MSYLAMQKSAFVSVSWSYWIGIYKASESQRIMDMESEKCFTLTTINFYECRIFRLKYRQQHKHLQNI